MAALGMPESEHIHNPTLGQHSATEFFFDVRRYGAKGDGKTLDSPAINKAIEAAANAGGGTVLFPAGTYLSYTIRLKSRVHLSLAPGSVILAAEVPREGTTIGGYDPAGPAQPWESYQDFGHNHWANSLIYGEGLENVSITGSGLLWGKGLSRGEPDELPRAESPGVGNKTIALKNCNKVNLRDFSILMGGHFGILLTGVDNAVIDGLTIDTNRDGIDIDCCRNVRVSNCVVNSPWDDAIVAKSSFALGEDRPTENLMITNCYVTGDYEFGSVIDGTFQHRIYAGWRKALGRIKCGTESSGGFRNVTISNCVLEACRGIGLFIVDGGTMEDICISNITMRNMVHPPFMLRLGKRMHGPVKEKTSLRRVILSNVSSSGAVGRWPSIIAGVPGLPIEDVQITNMFLEQIGGETPRKWSDLDPKEREVAYPDADMFGDLPASGFFLRHAKNLQFSNVEVAVQKNDPRPAFWAEDIDDLGLFRIRTPDTSPAFHLQQVRALRVFGSKNLTDRVQGSITKETIHLNG